MRKILIALVVIIVVSILWCWRGRDVTLAIDQIGTLETESRAVKTIAYQGSGTGGIFLVDDVSLSLNEIEIKGDQPSIGTTKDNQLALSYAGQVFAFGPLPDPENLTVAPQGGDTASVDVRRSLLSWPNFFEINFMTGHSPRWKRFTYHRLVWKKASGARLEMLWRYEQFYYPGPDGWTQALLSDPGLTGLIRVEISIANR